MLSKRKRNDTLEILFHMKTKFSDLGSFIECLEKFQISFPASIVEFCNLSNFRRQQIFKVIAEEKKNLKMKSGKLISRNLISKRKWDYFAANLLFYDERILPCYQTVKNLESNFFLCFPSFLFFL